MVDVGTAPRSTSERESLGRRWARARFGGGGGGQCCDDTFLRCPPSFAELQKMADADGTVSKVEWEEAMQHQGISLDYKVGTPCAHLRVLRGHDHCAGVPQGGCQGHPGKYECWVFATCCRQLRCTTANFPPTAVALPSTAINRRGS